MPLYGQAAAVLPLMHPPGARPFIPIKEKVMSALLRRLWQDESGQDADYAFFFAIVAVLLMAAFGPFRKILAAKFAAAAAVLGVPVY